MKADEYHEEMHIKQFIIWGMFIQAAGGVDSEGWKERTESMMAEGRYRTMASIALHKKIPRLKEPGKIIKKYCTTKKHKPEFWNEAIGIASPGERTLEFYMQGVETFIVKWNESYSEKIELKEGAVKFIEDQEYGEEDIMHRSLAYSLFVMEAGGLKNENWKEDAGNLMDQNAKVVMVCEVLRRLGVCYSPTKYASHFREGNRRRRRWSESRILDLSPDLEEAETPLAAEVVSDVEMAPDLNDGLFENPFDEGRITHMMFPDRSWEKTFAMIFGKVEEAKLAGKDKVKINFSNLVGVSPDSEKRKKFFSDLMDLGLMNNIHMAIAEGEVTVDIKKTHEQWAGYADRSYAIGVSMFERKMKATNEVRKWLIVNSKLSPLYYDGGKRIVGSGNKTEGGCMGYTQRMDHPTIERTIFERIKAAQEAMEDVFVITQEEWESSPTPDKWDDASYKFNSSRPIHTQVARIIVSGFMDLTTSSGAGRFLNIQRNEQGDYIIPIHDLHLIDFSSEDGSCSTMSYPVEVVANREYQGGSTISDIPGGSGDFHETLWNEAWFRSWLTADKSKGPVSGGPRKLRVPKERLDSLMMKSMGINWEEAHNSLSDELAEFRKKLRKIGIRIGIAKKGTDVVFTAKRWETHRDVASKLKDVRRLGWLLALCFDEDESEEGNGINNLWHTHIGSVIDKEADLLHLLYDG